MKIEATLLVSFVTMVFGIYCGMASVKSHYKAEARKESAQMTMVIVKLEGISEGISEIKSDLLHVKGDIKDITERLIVAEQSVKMAHKRLNEFQSLEQRAKKIKNQTNK